MDWGFLAVIGDILSLLVSRNGGLFVGVEWGVVLGLNEIFVEQPFLMFEIRNLRLIGSGEKQLERTIIKEWEGKI